MTRVGDAHKSLSQSVQDHLRSLIISGELTSGQRLTEEELAARFGVSRGPIRDALAELSRVGLVDITRRRGAQVVDLGPRDIDQLYTVRMSLEVLAISSLDQPMTKAQTDPLFEALDHHDRMIESGDVEASVDADIEFHRQICLLPDNPHLVAAWALLADQMSMVIAAVHRHDVNVPTDKRGHQLVAKSLRSGDYDKAADALRKHLNASRASVMTNFIERANALDSEHTQGGPAKTG
jgi:GntR family transcriptional regulator, gluconate operon transcriptional repressor